MTKDYRRYYYGCFNCQQKIGSKGKKLGDPKSLQLPTRRWRLISTDFITNFPVTNTGYDAITTYVDRLSRRVHFLPSRTSDSATDIAYEFFTRIIPQHGLLDTVISDRGPKFMSKFWQKLISLCDAQLKVSSARHPQTDGESEVANRMVENYILQSQKIWERHLSRSI